MHTAASTVSMLMSACSLTRRMIAPVASSVRSRLVTERYLQASSCFCVRAITVLIPRPEAARAIPAPTALFCAPEVTMTSVSVAARVAVVASHAHESFGADMEKNTVMMSNTRTTPNWSLIRDHSRSSARTVRCGLDRLLPTGRAYPLCAFTPEATASKCQELHVGLPGYNEPARITAGSGL